MPVHDAPVPQMGKVQVVEFMRRFDAPVVAEPVLAVPKIPLDKTRRRMGDYSRPPQTAEQLLEVPTIVSSSLQWAVEQYGDFLVPPGCGGLGGEGGLQGFSPGQGSAAYGGAEFVGIPVPGSGGSGGSRGSLQGFRPGQNSTADVEQNVDFPARGGLHGFLPFQGSSSSSRLHDVADGDFTGVFRTFPRLKKSAKLGPNSGSELSADFTPSTPAAYVDSVGPVGVWPVVPWTGTHLFGGTLLGDVVAAAGGGACGAVPGLGGRRPCRAGRPVVRPVLGQGACLEVPQVQYLRLWTSLCSCSDMVESRAQWKCLRFFAPFEDFPLAPEAVSAQFILCSFQLGQA